jgi:hypothetical protein
MCASIGGERGGVAWFSGLPRSSGEPSFLGGAVSPSLPPKLPLAYRNLVTFFLASLSHFACGPHLLVSALNITLRTRSVLRLSLLALACSAPRSTPMSELR